MNNLTFKRRTGPQEGMLKAKYDLKAAGQISNPAAPYPAPAARGVIPWAPHGLGSPAVYFWHLQHTWPLS